MRITRLVVVLAALLLAASSRAQDADAPALRALLVGVSGYPSLEPRLRLEGPRNDVRRLQQVLLQRGFKADNITLLADGVPGAGEPTRANIMAALQGLERSARPGETVLLYFAGHGSQQPADRSTPQGRAEPDGLHEIFLPIDIGRWDAKAGSVQNALVNHELRASVDRILARGAFVWGIFDSCHSASMVRGGDDDGERRLRNVDPRQLGLDPKALDAASAQAVRTRGLGDATAGALGPVAPAASGPGRPGDAVFFYAAQTTEVTPELRLPFGHPDRQPYGLFSFTLTRALETGQAMTYRQLAQHVLSQYGGIAEARVTPVFSGTALDQPVLGQRTAPLQQWPLAADRLTIPAGALSDIVPGAVFALVEDPLARTTDTQPRLRATDVQLTRTQLVPQAGAEMPAKLRPGLYARLVSNPMRYTLRLGVDAATCGRGCAWQPVLDLLRQTAVPGVDVEWVTADPDALLRVVGGNLVLRGPTAVAVKCTGERTCGDANAGVVLASAAALAKPQSAAEELAHSLHQVAKSTNLLRLSSRMIGADRSARVATAVEIVRAGDGRRDAMTPEAVPAVRSGDRVAIRLRNEGLRPVDVTLLYVDAHYGIDSLFPRDGEVNRLAPGDNKLVDDITISDADGVVGLERLMVIAVEAEPQSERQDFSALRQPSIKEIRTRGGPVSDDLQAFLDAAFADYRTRGQPMRVPSSATSMQVFTLDVRPSPRRTP